ncbi:MAG: DMT family transporter [Clostridia bacterium]|nr:DMT family transporter [Clostridia bacterium]
MKQNRILTIGFPLLAALIWGTAFSAQSMAADVLGPFTVNAARSTLAFFALGLGLIVFNAVRLRKTGETRKATAADVKNALIGGACCGTALFVAAWLQQAGLAYTPAGKAGFITALYVVLVPVFGLFLKKRTPATVWLGIALAVAGLYLLCIKDGFSVSVGDRYVLLCAVFFAVHILVIDKFTAVVDPVLLSCLQFGVAGVFSWIAAFLTETPTLAAIMSRILPILYVGLLSSAVAYTLQMIAQKYAEPVTLSLLLSLESVFSVLGGAVLLGERLSPRELAGCAVMFVAVLLAQIPPERIRALFSKKSA